MSCKQQLKDRYSGDINIRQNRLKTGTTNRNKKGHFILIKGLIGSRKTSLIKFRKTEIKVYSLRTMGL